MRIVGIVLVFAGLVPAGLAPVELMLCLHKDGRIFVEPYQPSCCKTACTGSEEECAQGPCGRDASPSDCPDEECQDVPLTITSAQIHSVPPGLTACAARIEIVPAPPVLACAGPLLIPESRSHSDFLGPPVARPETLLRSVVLRL